MPIFEEYLGKYQKNLENVIRHFGILMSYLTLDINLDNSPDRKIPVKFSSASKIYEAYMNDKEKIKTIFPVMTYQLMDMQYLPHIHLNNILGSKKFKNEEPENIDIKYLSAPYRITLSLNIMATKLAHVYQIIEQIVPAFTPTVMKCGISEITPYEPYFDKYNFTLKGVNLIPQGAEAYPSYLEDIHIAQLIFTVDIIMFAKLLKNTPEDKIKEIIVEYYAEDILDMKQYIDQNGDITYE